MPTLSLTDYPVQRYTAKPTDIMWIFTGAFCLIDNFAPTPVIVDVGFGNHWYRTSEHAFAAAKAANRDQHDGVRRQEDPGRAKALGRKVILRPDWEEVKFDMMWTILEAKFAQNADALAVLKYTEGRAIYEGNNWADRIWGVTQDGKQWVGRNALGIQLMNLRTQYFG